MAIARDATEVKKDIANLRSEITRLRRLLARAEIEGRDQLLTRLYGLERDAAALRHALQSDPHHTQPTIF